MKIVMTTAVSAIDASYGVGDEVDLPDVLAKQWISAGYAESAEDVEEQDDKPPVAPVPAKKTAPKARNAKSATTTQIKP